MRKFYSACLGLKTLCLIVLLLFSFSTIFAQNQQTINTAGSGNINIPAGVTQITVECWGAGGAGGSTGTNGNRTAGGGGGAYARKIVTVTPGLNSYTVGAAGGDSYFINTTTVLAKGGQNVSAASPTTGGAGGSGTSSVGTITFSGGNGASSSTSSGNTGGGGSSAGSGSNGNNAAANVGGTAPTNGGAGANGLTTSGNGNSGNIPGGGGSGGWKQGNGTGAAGSGAPGQIRITYFTLTNTSAINPVCQNNTNTVTLTSTTAILPAGTYTVTYNLTGANTATGSTATMTVSTAGSGSFVTSSLPNGGSTTVTITNLASGIYSSSIPANNTSTFNVSTVATPTITAGGPTTFCTGGSVILTSSASSGNQWYKDGILISSANNQNYSATTDGIYTVVVTSGTCTSLPSAGTTVTTNALPATPTVTPSGPTTFCTDASLTLTSTTATSYQWYKNGSVITGEISQNYSPTTSGTYTVVVKNAAGCSSAPSPGVSVTVNPLPSTPTITPNGPTTFCAGGSVMLTSSSATTYQWYDDNGIISGATSQNYTPTSNGSYRVRITNSSGCIAVSANTAITVNPLPDITISSQALGLCSSSGAQTTQLSYSNTDNFPTTYSITWGAAATSAGFTNVTNTALPASPISITVPANAAANTYGGTLTVKNGNGCQSTAKSFTVTIAATPNVSNLSVSAANGCVGIGAVITISSNTIANGSYTVKYDLSGANTTSASTATMIFSGNSGTFTVPAANTGATNITVTEIALVGCSAPVSSGNTASFNVNSLPPAATISGSSNVCVNASIDLDASTAGGTWASSEPSVASVDNNGIVTGLMSGTTTITYTTSPNGNGCTNSTTKTITINALPNVEAITGQTAYCVGTTSSLSNQTPNGSWNSSNPSVATIDNDGLVTAIAIGTTVITYTTPNNAAGCNNSTQVTVNVNPDPTVIAGADLDLCESASPTGVMLSGASYGGGASSAIWSIQGGGGSLSSQGAGNNPANITYTPAANFHGTVTLKLTTNTVGTCGAAVATRIITVTERPLVSAGSTIIACQSALPAPITLINATISGSATTAAWSIISGGGTLSDESQVSNPADVTYTPASNFSGTVTLRLTTNANGVCSANFAERTIIINATPVISAGNQNSICQFSSPAPLTLSGATLSGGATTGAWSLTQGTGSLSSTAQTANPASVIFTPTANFTGTVKLTLTSNAPAGCNVVTAERIIDITPASTVIAGGPNTVCQASGVLTLSGASIGGGATSGAWSVTSGGGLLSSSDQNATPATVTYTPDPAFSGTALLLLTSNATGNCPAVSQTRTVTINPSATIALTSAATTNAQTICINTAITNITYSVGGGGTGATVSGLPTGVSGSYSGGVFTISGSPTVSGGPFTYTVNTTGTCTQTSATGTITVNPSSVGGSISPALTTNCSSSATGTINLSGNTGAILKWQSSVNGGATWTDITNTTSSYNYNVTVTTIYRAVIQNGVCSPVNSAAGVVSVIPAFKPAPVIATPTAICAGQTSIITSGTGYPTIGIADTSGDFHNANPPGWCVDKDCTGSVLPANGDNTANGVWRETNSHTFNGIAFSRPDKFAIVNGSFNSVLETPVFSLIAQPFGLLNFLQAYNLNTGANIKIELSTDGGTTYAHVLQNVSGVASYGISGAASSLTASTLDLTNYLGLSNLRLRFNYTGSANSVWALDNVKVPGNLPITYTWSEPPSGSPTIITPVTQTPITVQPPVTTTYTITTYVGGCLSGSENVTITVYPLPTITLGTNPSICSGTTTANLPFTATTNTPNKYSIVYNAAAITAGLVNVTNATFPATSPISLTVPAGITPGTYNGSISVSNINNCGSTSVPFTITVRPLPTASISGGNFCKVSTTTLTVSNTTGGPFTGASFTATPAGLSINSGTGVIDLAASTAGTYTVSYSYVGANGCSNSAGSSNSTVVINSISSITSQPSDLIFCPESNTATFSVAATGASIYQWQYRPNSSSAWVNVPASTPYSGETTNALTVTTPTYIARAGLDGYQYQVLLNPSSACPVTSGFATLSVRNIWKGITSKDWNTGANWSGGLIPTLSCENVIVLASTPMGDPILSSGPAGEVNSLIIMPGATVTVTGNTLKIAGTITDDDNALNATNGKIELNGNIGLNGIGTRPAQTIAGRMFATPKLTKSGRIKDLQISNPKGATVAAPTVTDTLNITGHLSFGAVSGVTLTTNDNVTLISDANGTASVDEIAVNGAGNPVNNFKDSMIVERFIPGHRAWRLLTTPVKTSQTINDAWQEGAVNQTLPYVDNKNPHPGYGTHITGIARGTDWVMGYDAGPQNNFSLKVHDRTRNTYLIGDGYRGIEQVYPSAPGMNTPINYLEGYIIFVRGGRDIDLNLNTAAPPTNTVLRAKGTLKTGTQTITQTLTGFNLVGNPFASTLNLSKIKQDGVAPEFVYVYDPRAGSIGNFQTLFLTGGSYSPIPGGGSYAAPYNIPGNNIQSGQAFFVQSIVPGSVVIKEEAKDLTANSMIFSPVTQTQQLRTNLYVVNTSTDLLDATLTQYSSDGNNAIDGKDAMKIPAIGAGTYLSMLRDGKNLIIERRQSITTNDTIFYNLMTASKRNYRFEFVVDNMELDGLSGFLEDAYLKTSTPVNLNGTTALDFTVNTDAASAASDRFRLVFKAKVIPPPPLPFTFKNVQVDLQTNDIAVKWLTENESDIKSYDIETSANGLQFVTSATITSKRGKAIEDYQWLDTDTKPGMHYYRIRSVNDKGDVVYSTIVSVNINIVTSRRDIKVYPNPVTEGRINVMFMNQPEGNYNLRLVNALGQVILAKQIYHASGSSMKILRVSKNKVDGIYKLEITRPDKSTYNINVILQ